MRKNKVVFILCVMICFSCRVIGQTDVQNLRTAEIDRQLWKEVSRSVQEGDFEGYSATNHENAVLVTTTGKNKESYSISKALSRWKEGFINTKAGKQFDKVEFRFSQRIGDETTGHETGMFHFSSYDSSGKQLSHGYIHFEALLIKENNRWKILMEYQKMEGTLADWEALK